MKKHYIDVEVGNLLNNHHIEYDGKTYTTDGYKISKDSLENWFKLHWQYENYPKRYDDYFPKEDKGTIRWYHKGKLEEDENNADKR